MTDKPLKREWGFELHSGKKFIEVYFLEARLMQLRDELIHKSICRRCTCMIEEGLGTFLCSECIDRRDSIMFVFDELLSELEEARGG